MAPLSLVGPVKPVWAAGEAVHVKDAMLELELDGILVVGLETDVMMVECELEDWVLDRLLDCTLETADDFEFEAVVEGVLITEELTVECALDECVLKLLDEAVEWLLEVTTDFVLLELLNGMILDETAVLMLEELVKDPGVFVVSGVEFDELEPTVFVVNDMELEETEPDVFVVAHVELDELKTEVDCVDLALEEVVD